MTLYKSEKDNINKQKATLKTRAEKTIEQAKNAGFPNCKGLYPDCPEKPNKNNTMCKTCPILDKPE